MKKLFTLVFGLFLLLNSNLYAQPMYCTSSASFTGDSKIDSVTLGSIAFGSVPSNCETYTDNSHLTTSLVIGFTYPYRILLGSCGGSFTRSAKIFIDWNEDGDFTDMDEEVAVMGPTSFGGAVRVPFSGSFTVPNGTPAGAKRMRVVCVETSLPNSIMPCGTYSFGETEDYTVFVLPNTGVDAVAGRLVAPKAPIPPGLNAYISFEIQNLALDPITTATVGYQLDNNPPVTENWIGSLPSGTSIIHTFFTPVTLPVSGNPNLKVWVTHPNKNASDNTPGNDTLRTNICFALAGGIYTIGGPGANFADISSALQAMQCGGISGDVIFKINPGTYTGSYLLNEIQGSNFYRTQFTSSTGIASDVVLEPSAGQNFVFDLINTANVAFHQLTFNKASGTTFDAINFRVNSNSGSVTNCDFNDASGSSSTNNRAISATGTSGIVLYQNNINNFGRAIHFSGNPRNFSLNNIIQNNNINNAGSEAIFIENQAFLRLIGNKIEDIRSTFTTAVDIRNIQNILVSKNSITGNLGDNGIRLQNMDTYLNGKNQVINNVVSGTFQSGSPVGIQITGTYSPGIDSLDALDLYHNTIHMEISGGFIFGAIGAINLDVNFASLIPAFSQINIQNNDVYIGASPGGGIPMEYRAIAFGDQSILDSTLIDYNNYFFDGSNNDLASIGNNDYTTIIDWRNGSGQEANSWVIPQLHLSINNPIPGSPALNNRGNYVGINDDILTTARSQSSPDIGAYEFTIPLIDIAVLELTEPNQGCGLSNAEPVSVIVQNTGIMTYDSSLDPLNITLNVNGSSSAHSFNNIILPSGQKDTLSLGTVDMTQAGTYTFNVTSSVVADSVPINDDLGPIHVESIPSIGSFPYAQNFDAGNAGWTAGGNNSSWQLGTPTGGTINSAASGSNSWVTNLSGSYTPSEQSWLQSPCFDLTSLATPFVRFNIWWDAESGFDGGNLAYSTDGGQTWQVLGNTTSGGTNWYSQNSVSASNGEPVWNNNAGGSGGWISAQHSLMPLAGQSSVIFRFQFYCDISVQFEGIGIDDFEVLDPPTFDGGVTASTSPSSGCGLTSSELISVEINNFGLAPLVMPRVGYIINNNPAVIDTVTNLILSGASSAFTFTVPADLSAIGVYNIKVFTMVTGDLIASNDTLFFTVENIPSISTFPYFEDFESGNGSWQEGGNSSSWQFGTPNGFVIGSAASGTNAWVTGLSGNYNNGEQSWLQSPCFDFTSLTQASVSFNIWWDCENLFDGGNLAYSLDGGSTFLTVGAMNSGSNWYNSASVSASNNQPVWTNVNGGSNAWLPALHNVDFLAGQSSIIFRFQFHSDGSVTNEGIGIDDFRIFVPGLPTVDTVNQLSNNCQTSIRTVEAKVTSSTPLLGVSLQYDLTGGTNFISVPMMLNAMDTTWQGNIPASNPGNKVSYRVIAIDVASQRDTSAVFCYTDAALNGMASPDTTINQGDMANLRVNSSITSGVTYTWTDGTNTIGMTPTISVNPTTTSWYYVTVSDGTCSFTDSVLVTVMVIMSDVGVSGIISPSSGAVIDSTTRSISIWVKNYGNVNQSNVDVSYSINGSNTVNETFTGTLNPGDSSMFTFAQQWMPNMNGINTICAFTGLTSDLDNSNDTTCISIRNNTSIRELQTSAFIGNVYPNPANDFVFFEWAESLELLEIYNSIGQLTMQIDLETNQKQIYKLDITTLANGIYHFKVLNDNKYQTGKFIISR